MQIMSASEKEFSSTFALGARRGHADAPDFSRVRSVTDTAYVHDADAATT